MKDAPGMVWFNSVLIPFGIVEIPPPLSIPPLFN
jgi:hypothetical protein